MRKSFDGPVALVFASGEDIVGGNLIVFVWRRGDRHEVPRWNREGFVLWYCACLPPNT